MNDDITELYSSLLTIMMSELSETSDLFELLSDETRAAIQQGSVPERLTFNKEKLLNSLATLLETYLNEFYDVSIAEPSE